MLGARTEEVPVILVKDAGAVCAVAWAICIVRMAKKIKKPVAIFLLKPNPGLVKAIALKDPAVFFNEEKLDFVEVITSCCNS